MKIRKVVTVIEDVSREANREANPILRKVSVTAVCSNPCAGGYTEDLAALIQGSEQIGRTVARMAAEMMMPYSIESYGKGALVGINGEVEHAEAVLTTVFGDTLRQAAGGGKAWICHMAKMALPGTSMDIPLAHKDALMIRSHYDAMVVAIPDAPMPDEILITCCFANRGRLNHRIGGHGVKNIIGEDGLR